MCEIFSQEHSNLKTEFIESWNKYVVGILMYSEGNSKLKSRNELDSSSECMFFYFPLLNNIPNYVLHQVLILVIQLPSKF